MPKFPLLAAVEAAALNASEQELLEEVLQDERYRLNAQNAKVLRTTWRDGDSKTLTAEQIRFYLEPTEKTPATVNVKVKQDVISRYFGDDDKPDAISDTIAQALEAWFASKSA
jgi:hypothetical protein